MKKISITEALNELKLYDKRISKAINNGKFIVYAKKPDISIDGKPIEEYKDMIKADADSVISLIRNRDIVKNAVVLSNATTKLTIGSETMTVAEAIETKQSIEYRRDFLNQLTIQYRNMSATVKIKNDELNSHIQKLIDTAVGKDSKDKVDHKDQIEAITKTQLALNEYVLIDPINILDTIKVLKDEIDEFESNVNTALVISNSTTFIELDI